MADMYFLSKNYVSASDTINVSSGASYKSRIYDQRYDFQWISSGETAEAGYNTYIEIIFYEQSAVINRTYDTIVLQGINLKKFKLQNYTGGSYADIAGSEYIVNADASVRIKLAAPVTGSKIKLLMQSTIAAGEEKKVGELWVCLQNYQLSNPKSARSQQNQTEMGFYRFANGAGAQWFIYDKWQKTYKIDYLTNTQIDSLYAIFNSHATITFYEDYARDINLIKLVAWVGSFMRDDNPKTKLNTLTMALREV